MGLSLHVNLTSDEWIRRRGEKGKKLVKNNVGDSKDVKAEQELHEDAE